MLIFDFKACGKNQHFSAIDEAITAVEIVQIVELQKQQRSINSSLLNPFIDKLADAKIHSI